MMSKYKGHVIACIIFFLLINTSCLWEGELGIFAMVSFLVLVLYFMVLAGLFLRQFYLLIREKFTNRPRFFLTSLMAAVLMFTLLFPGGILPLFGIESVLIAQREGAANCMTTLTLNADHRFTERSVCFGIRETTGSYTVKGDTIFFSDIEPSRAKKAFYEYAVIEGKKQSSSRTLMLYRNFGDTTAIPLWIMKNKIFE